MIEITPLLQFLFWISVIYLVSEQFLKEIKKNKNINLKDRIGELNPELNHTIRDRMNQLSSK
jgi:hypothetical protein